MKIPTLRRIINKFQNKYLAVIIFEFLNLQSWAHVYCLNEICQSGLMGY